MLFVLLVGVYIDALSKDELARSNASLANCSLESIVGHHELGSYLIHIREETATDKSTGDLADEGCGRISRFIFAIGLLLSCRRRHSSYM